MLGVATGASLAAAVLDMIEDHHSVGLVAVFVGLAKLDDYAADVTDKKWLHAIEAVALSAGTSINTS